MKWKCLFILGKVYVNMFVVYVWVGEFEIVGSIWVSIEEVGIELDYCECVVMVEVLLVGKVYE